MTTHSATSIIAVEVPSSSSTTTTAASASPRWERNPTVALVLGLSLFNVDAAPVNFSDGVVLYEVLCYGLIRECDKAKATRGPSVYVLQYDGVVDLSKLHEVLLEFLTGQLEVKSTDEDLAFRVSELDGVLRVITTTNATILVDYLYIRVRLLNVLSIVSHQEVVVVVMTSMMVIVASTTHMTALSSALMVICRLDINAFVQDIMAVGLVLADNAPLYLLSLIFVIEAQEDKTETAAPLRQLLPHDNSVLDLAELLEIRLEVLFACQERQSSYEEFHLILLCGLMEGGC